VEQTAELVATAVWGAKKLGPKLRMGRFTKASSKIAFGASGSCTPFQSGWVVSWPAATEPSLALGSKVVKVALSCVSF
jgi:hypothetical protein